MLKRSETATDQTRTQARLNPFQAAILTVAFFLISLVFLVSFSNHADYNGDAMNMIVPMFHLSEAKEGALLIYRYAWQPLCYEFGAAIFGVTKSPDAIFLIAPVSGAISLLLLLLITWRDRASISTFVASVVMLLAIPEFWFSGLYFNSTIMGLPFVLLAIVILNTKPRPYIYLIVGLLMSVAVMMRLDFILTCPAVALIAWQRGRTFAGLIGLMLGVLLGLSFGFFAGWIDPLQAIETYRSAQAEIVEKAQSPGWDRRLKLGVISVMLSPVGWAIILLGGPLVVYRYIRHNAMSAILWPLALLPTGIPLLNLLSAKYALPLLIFFPPFMRRCFSEIESKVSVQLKPWPLWLATLGTIFFLLISFSFYGHPPFVQIGTLASRPVHTHSGLRSYGGYWWQAANVRGSAQSSEQRPPADAILHEILTPSGPDLVIAGGEDYFDRGGVGWRLVQLELERGGFRGRVIAPHQVQFDVNGRRLTLLSELSPDTMTQLDRGRGIVLHDLRD